MFEVKTPVGKKQIKIARFAALDGWDIHMRFSSFADSKDAAYRRKYVLRVLSYAKVVLNGGAELPLITDALVDNHLYTPQNVSAVFHAVLKYNGITPEGSAQVSTYQNAVGNEIATSFITQCMGAMQQFSAFMTRSRANV